DSFEIILSGTTNKFSTYIKLHNPTIVNHKIKQDVYEIPMPVKIDKLEISADLLANNNSFSINNGKVFVEDIMGKFSFSYSNGNIINYNVSLQKTECSKLMNVNPFKSAFHFQCTPNVVDVGRCKGEDNLLEETQYSGQIEFNISGETVTSPSF